MPKKIELFEAHLDSNDKPSAIILRVIEGNEAVSIKITKDEVRKLITELVEIISQ